MSSLPTSSPSPSPISPERRALIVGALAALIAALIGSGWQLASRYAVTTTLGPVELAVMRYGIPALLLMPFWCKTGLFPSGVPRGRLALLVMGGGLPFGLVALAGVQWAPAAHMGMLMAGSVPLFAACGGWWAWGDKLSGSRICGLALVVAGIAVFGAGAWQTLASSWRGDVLFVAAALLWSVYSLAFRGCGLTPWQGAAVVNLWSALLLLPLWAVWGAPLLVSAPWRDVAWQALGQGLVAGILGLVVYTVAINRLGAARAALSAALVPPFTALGAALLLNETLAYGTLAALALVMPGVALASGAFGRSRG